MITHTIFLPDDIKFVANLSEENSKTLTECLMNPDVVYVVIPVDDFRTATINKKSIIAIDSVGAPV